MPRQPAKPEPNAKPKRKRPLQSELLGPAGWKPLLDVESNLWPFVIDHVPRKATRDYYRRIAEQTREQMKLPPWTAEPQRSGRQGPESGRRFSIVDMTPRTQRQRSDAYEAARGLWYEMARDAGHDAPNRDPYTVAVESLRDWGAPEGVIPGIAGRAADRVRHLRKVVPGSTPDHTAMALDKTYD